jgi:hypothetical protein
MSSYDVAINKRQALGGGGVISSLMKTLRSVAPLLALAVIRGRAWWNNSPRHRIPFNSRDEGL